MTALVLMRVCFAVEPAWPRSACEAWKRERGPLEEQSRSIPHPRSVQRSARAFQSKVRSVAKLSLRKSSSRKPELLTPTPKHEVSGLVHVRSITSPEADLKTITYR